MSSSITYGAYSFSPVPFVQINKQYIKTAAGINIGVTFSLTITGNICDRSNSGLSTLMNDARDLREAFNQDGKLFQIKCNDEVLLECYPRITSIDLNESNDNWVFTIPFTINIEYENDPTDVGLDGYGEDTSLHPQFIADFQEDWAIEFAAQDANPYTFGGESQLVVLRVSHNLSAVGKSHYSGVGLTGTLDMPAWQQARDYINNYLGYDNNLFSTRTDLNLPTGTYPKFDHYRVNNVNETAGSYATQETWIVVSGDKKAIEDFTVDIQEGVDQEFYTVNLQGQIQGLEERTYGSAPGDFNVSVDKYTNAYAHYTGVSAPLAVSRANVVALPSLVTLNTTPLVKSVSHSPKQGVVSYNYSFNNRPANCIAGARFENITIQDTNPHDVFALIPIMGRPQGPIIQSMNTVTEFQRNVSIDVLMNPATGCTTGTWFTAPVDAVVTAYLRPIEQNLRSVYSGGKVKKSADTESWSPKTGRYSRQVTWTAVPCNSAPSTTFI